MTHSLEGCCSIQLSYGQKDTTKPCLVVRDGGLASIEPQKTSLIYQQHYATSFEHCSPVCSPVILFIRRLPLFCVGSHLYSLQACTPCTLDPHHVRKKLLTVRIKVLQTLPNYFLTALLLYSKKFQPHITDQSQLKELTHPSPRASSRGLFCSQKEVLIGVIDVTAPHLPFLP